VKNKDITREKVVDIASIFRGKWNFGIR